MKYIIFTTLFIITINQLIAQQIVSGTVSDANTGDPITGVEIWNHDMPNTIELSQSKGKFELETEGQRILLKFKKSGYHEYSRYVSLPEYNMTVNMQPINQPMLEFTFIIKSRQNTRQRIDSTQLFFDNINGYDNFSKTYKHIINIPVKEIEKRDNRLHLFIEKENMLLDTTIIVSEQEKETQIKSTDLFVSNPENIEQENNTSKLAVVIPGLYQYRTGQNTKASTILISQVVSITGVVAMQGLYSKNYNDAQSNKGNTSLYTSYMNKADNFELSKNIFIGISAGIYLYNIIDGLAYKPENRRYTFVPAFSPSYIGFMCNIKLNK